MNNLSEKQTAAFDAVMAWHKGHDKRFVLAGYAGAGKTTLAKHIANAIGEDRVVFCAYTSKAASVLRDKGCKNSSTIHSAIYTRVEYPDGTHEYILDEESTITKARLVIVDEYSMLPRELRGDLETLAKRVLYLGDPFQLPPVKGECDLKPDHFLEEIHRQALDSTIVQYATMVRQGKRIGFIDKPDLRYIPRGEATVADFMAADQIIVGKNDTRQHWNTICRGRLFGKNVGQYPVAGDRLICCKNNHGEGIYNGLITACTRDTEPPCPQAIPENMHVDLFTEHGRYDVWRGDFDSTTPPDKRTPDDYERFAYGYAITCHKAQGSEFDHVAVYNQPIGRDYKMRQRWTYTAITRAAKKLLLVEPTKG